MSGQNDGSRFGIDDKTSKSDNNNDNNGRFDSLVSDSKGGGDDGNSNRGRGHGRGGRGRGRGGRGDGYYRQEGENTYGEFDNNGEGPTEHRRERGGRIHYRGGYNSTSYQNDEEGGETKHTYRGRGRGRGRGAANYDNNNTYNNNVYGGNDNEEQYHKNEGGGRGSRGRGRGRGAANYDNNNTYNNNVYGGDDNEEQYHKNEGGGRGSRGRGGERGTNSRGQQRTSRGRGYHNNQIDEDYIRVPPKYVPATQQGVDGSTPIEVEGPQSTPQDNEDAKVDHEHETGREQTHNNYCKDPNEGDGEPHVRRGRGRGHGTGNNDEQGGRGGRGRNLPQSDSTLTRPGRTQRAIRLRHNNFDEEEVEKLFKSHHNQSGISFDNYNSIEVQVFPQDIPPVMSFEELNVDHHLAANIARCGYKNPTPVQKYAISIALAGGDIMACAQTGSGKTAAFVIPVIQYLLVHGVSPAYERVSCPVGLILAPTRELALQIFDDVKKMAYKTDIFADVSYGGKSYPSHFENDVLVACPGRLKDLFDREKVSFECVKFLVLDEADRMLEMGFEDQIRYLCDSQFSDMPPPEKRQTFMFSATFPESIRELGQRYLRQRHYLLTVGRVGSTTKNITQRVRNVEHFEKREALLDIICEQLQEDLVLVFVETKREADDLWYFLEEEGIPCNAIHGDREQWEREEALKKFKNGTCPILIATDVASRGLDIPNVTHVIQYDLPKSMDDYTHRIGRTGRAGNKGTATSFFNSSNANIAAELMAYLAEHQQEVPVWMEDIADEETARRYMKSNRGGRRGGGGGGGNRHNNNRYDDAPDSWDDYRVSGSKGGGSSSATVSAAMPTSTTQQRQQPKKVYDDGGF